MACRFDSQRKQWFVEFEQTGIRVYRRLPKGCTEAQGKALETKLRREIFDRETLDKRPDITIRDAIDQWLGNNRRKNQRQAASEARQWDEWVGGRLLKEAPQVAAEAVREWARLRTVPKTMRMLKYARDTDMSAGADGVGSAIAARCASTINRRLMMLKAVCKWAWRQNLIPDNVSGRIQTLKEPPGREVYLTRSQVMKLADAAPDTTTRTAILIAAYCGLRVSELLALTSYHSRADMLVVRESKTGKPRLVPVPEPARISLRLWLASERPSYWQLHSEFLVARKKAKMPHVKFHDLRHTCASWLINEGVDLFTVGKILGHSSPQTTARYSHLATATLEKAMRRLK
jgi:integrase